MDLLPSTTSTAIVTVISVLVLILSIQFLARKLREKRGKKKYHPIGGTVINQLINFNRMFDYMTELATKYSTYRLLGFFRSEVYTSDPVNVEYILKTNFQNYGKGEYNNRLLKDLLGDGIFTVDGNQWREQRKLSSHEFSTRVLRDFSSVVFRKNVVKLANIVSEAATSNQPMDIQIQFKKEDILSRFLQLTEANPKYLRDIILNFIIAGKDTTATTLSWFIYMLCKYPLVQEKVVQEINWAVDSKAGANLSEFADSVNEAALEKMQYLHAVLTETLRLYPSVPADAKVCLSDDTMPDGYSVKRGDMVAYLPYAMGRMKSIWGDDAEEFKPERWLDENGCFRHESPFKFTAFQGGPRICLGKEFAYRQMKIFAAVLLKWFVFKLWDEKKAVKYITMINLHIDGGLHVLACHRIDHEKAIHSN